MSIHQPEEILLSYLVGLAPVGQTFEINRKVLMADLGLKHAAYYYRLIQRLITLRALKRIACAAQGAGGLFVVLKRPEHVTFSVRQRYDHYWRSKQRWADFRARLNPDLTDRQRAGA